MLITLIIYYILYIFYILALIPKDSLFYIRPLSIILLTLILWPIYIAINRIRRYIIKKSVLTLYLIIINTIFFIILGEFAKISIKITIILSITLSISILLRQFKSKFLKLGSYAILIIMVILIIWPGEKISYTSKLDSVSNINHKVRVSYYGYSETYTTEPVDSSTFYTTRTPLTKWYDKAYWNIKSDLPVKGIIYQPKEQGFYPLIILVHGNHLAENPSHKGYYYLLSHLAQNGYIAVSIDQNFLNGNWTNLGAGLPQENDVRGVLINHHIDNLIKMNSDPTSSIYNSIDTDNIGLIGHSRGGEAISIAAKRNIRHNIKAIASLAPTDRQFPENIVLKDISYITIHGSNDGDLRAFDGINQFNRVNFTKSDFNLKATYYIEGVNHNQFNTDWGKLDSTGPGKIFSNRVSNITSRDQQEISKVLVKNFFDTVLKKEYHKLDLIKSPIKNPTIPEIKYITNYIDSSYKIIGDFSFRNPLNKKILFNNIKHTYVKKNSNRYLELQWEKGGSVEFKIPRNSSSQLTFSLASDSYKSYDIEVRIKDSNKIIKRKTVKVEGKLEKKFMKFKLLNGTEDEAHFQSYKISINSLSKWDSVELILEGRGTLSIDNLGVSTLHQKKE